MSFGMIMVLYGMRGENTPPISDNFLLLSGEDFLLLDMTEFFLLGT